jgi:hypothetical protein
MQGDSHPILEKMRNMIFADKKQVREPVQTEVFVNMFFDIADQIPLEILFTFSISFGVQTFINCPVEK